jgi:hypothetical protein
MLLVMHSSLLVFRTAISLYVASLDGKCVYDNLTKSGRMLISYIKDCRLSGPGGTHSLPPQHRPMAPCGYPGHLDEQLAKLHPE